ncbi:phospholipid carrier-dependent glycosyltransferase [Klebsiella pneumoniae]|nr:phospholipid carrier-dependent glycosyltransferase [Klebsiella pneumoniae]
MYRISRLAYFEKPICRLLDQQIGQWLFGHNNFGVRFGSVFAITMTPLLGGLAGLRIFRDKRGSYSCRRLSSSTRCWSMRWHPMRLDPMITLWLPLAMCSFYGRSAGAQPQRQNTGLRAAGVAAGWGDDKGCLRWRCRWWAFCRG